MNNSSKLKIKNGENKIIKYYRMEKNSKLCNIKKILHKT